MECLLVYGFNIFNIYCCTMSFNVYSTNNFDLAMKIVVRVIVLEGWEVFITEQMSYF